MNVDKKEDMFEKQKYMAIIKRNKWINKLNIAVLAVGLLLTFTNYNDVGGQVIWLGIIIFAYTFASNFIARSSMQKLK